MIVLNYLLYYLILIPLSLLPFKVLYAISDFLYVILFNIAGYRKKVVEANVKNSFPGLRIREQKQIVHLFYSHLCDLIVESIKIFTISEKQIRKRMVIRNSELTDKYFNEGKSVIIAGGHLNNWELFAVAIDKPIKHQAIGIYLPLTNKFFDRKMQKTRSRYGLKMISTKSVKKFFEDEVNNLNAVIFAIDQSPSNPKNCYWTTFLNQDTAVPFGTEKYARQYNYPVVYGRINKIKRGFYEFEFLPVAESPKQTTQSEITETVTRLLEKDIIAAPQYWLWTHRRWKHKRIT